MERPGSGEGVAGAEASLRVRSRQDALDPIGELGNNSTLTCLDISGLGLGPEGARELARALASNSTLTKLDLGQNELGREGARHVAELLARNSTLTQLDLTHNAIGHPGGYQIAKALSGNFSLTSLHFDLGLAVPVGLLERNKRFQADRRRIRRTLGA